MSKKNLPQMTTVAHPRYAVRAKDIAEELGMTYSQFQDIAFIEAAAKRGIDPKTIPNRITGVSPQEKKYRSQKDWIDDFANQIFHDEVPPKTMAILLDKLPQILQDRFNKTKDEYNYMKDYIRKSSRLVHKIRAMSPEVASLIESFTKEYSNDPSRI